MIILLLMNLYGLGSLTAEPLSVSECREAVRQCQERAIRNATDSVSAGCISLQQTCNEMEKRGYDSEVIVRAKRPVERPEDPSYDMGFEQPEITSPGIEAPQFEMEKPVIGAEMPTIEKPWGTNDVDCSQGGTIDSQTIEFVGPDGKISYQCSAPKKNFLVDGGGRDDVIWRADCATVVGEERAKTMTEEQCKESIANNCEDDLVYENNQALCEKYGDVAGEPEPGPGDEDPTDPDGDLCPDDKLRAAADECDQKFSKADSCCGGGALGCAFSGSDGQSNQGMAQMGSIATMFIALGAQMQSKQDLCEGALDLAKLSTGLNGLMAGGCEMTRNSCRSTCRLVEQQADRYITQVQGEVDNLEAAGQAGSQAASIKRTCLNRLKEIKDDKIEGNYAQCGNMFANTAQFAGQAGMSYLQGKQAEACKDAVNVATPPVPPTTPGGDDWCADAKDLSNPFCRQQLCSQPGMANQPECQGVQVAEKTSGGGGGGGLGSAGGFGNRPDADVTGLDTEGAQQFAGADIEAAQNSVSAASGGGGGQGLPGAGSAGGGGGGGDGGGGQGGGKGFKTDILNGLSGGSGYTTSSGGRFAGGGGYSAPVGGSKKKGKGFNLNDFLPKKKKAKGRNLAGLASSKNAKIASKFDDIWVRVSNKYKEKCLMRQLMCGK